MIKIIDIFQNYVFLVSDIKSCVPFYGDFGLFCGD